MRSSAMLAPTQPTAVNNQLPPAPALPPGINRCAGPDMASTTPIHVGARGLRHNAIPSRTRLTACPITRMGTPICPPGCSAIASLTPTIWPPVR